MRGNQKIFYFIAFGYVFFTLLEPYHDTRPGLDNSWHQSLCLAIDNNLIFGKDFIFNYGPLGFLNTFLIPKSVPIIVQPIFHCFVLLNYILIINNFLIKYPTQWKVVVLTSFYILCPTIFIGDVSFCLFLFLIFWVLEFDQTRKREAIAFIILLPLLIFFIKKNLSIIGYLVFLISILKWVIFKTISIKEAIIICFTAFFSLYLVSLFLNVSIPSYLVSSVKIIDAYQDAMAINYVAKSDLILSIIIESLFLLIGICFLLINKISFKQNYFMFFLILLYLFVSFKQAHTALLFVNIYSFIVIIPIVCTLIIYFLESKKLIFSDKKFLLIIFGFQLLITSLFRNGLTKSDNILPSFSFFESKNIIEYTPFNYISKLFTYDYENNFNEKNLADTKLPLDIKTMIGNNSVDILPDHISYLFFNKLNYTNRPIIQTYQANSNWLQEKNGDFFKDVSKRPTFVLAQISSFRNQHPFWVDKGAYQQLLLNYNLEKRFTIKTDSLILFKTKEKYLTIDQKLLSIKKYNLADSIEIPHLENKLIYFKGNIHYNLLGKLFRFVFQPPQLWCAIKYQNNEIHYYRIPPSLLEAGILVNRKVETQNDFYELCINKGANNMKVKSIVFDVLGGFGFEREFKGEFYSVNFE